MQLVPDPSIPTLETGTRHRTAERAAIQTGFVIGAGQIDGDDRAGITTAAQSARRLDHDPREGQPGTGHSGALPAASDEVGSTLSALEVEDLVTARRAVGDTRLEMVRRMSAEIDAFVVDWVWMVASWTLQLREVVSGVGADQVLLMRDYILPDADDYATTIRDLDASDDASLMDLISLATRMGLATDLDGLDQPLSPGATGLAGCRALPNRGRTDDRPLR